MPLNGFRLAYVLEYLIAIVVILNLWTEVGGAGHMDLISWYTKLTLTLGLATAIVLGTASAVRGDRAWNARTIGWSLMGLALVCAMGAATYYAHLHEDDDPDSGDTNTPIAYFLSGEASPVGGLAA